MRSAEKGFTEKNLKDDGYMVFHPEGAGMDITDAGLTMAGGELLFAKAAAGISAWWLARGASRFGELSVAEAYGIQAYAKLKGLTKGTELEAHHLIEQRFASTLGTTASSMESIAVTKAEHQVFTNAWRARIGYNGSNAIITTGSASKEQIYQAARIIYKDYPHILKTLGL